MDQGHIFAQHNYALMCENGKGGEQDFKEARYYYKLAAAQQSKESQNNYALMCQHGKGEPPNMVEVEKYFKMAQANQSKSPPLKPL